MSFVGATLLLLGGGLSFVVGVSSFVCGGLVCGWWIRLRAVQVVRGWGVVVIRGAPSLSVGIVVCGRGRCSWGWALSLVGAVIICGAGLSFVGAVSSFVGAGCH